MLGLWPFIFCSLFQQQNLNFFIFTTPATKLKTMSTFNMQKFYAIVQPYNKEQREQARLRRNQKQQTAKLWPESVSH